MVSTLVKTGNIASRKRVTVQRVRKTFENKTVLIVSEKGPKIREFISGYTLDVATFNKQIITVH